MSSETVSTTTPGDRTEASEWFGLGGGVLVVALVLAAAGWWGAQDDARVVVLLLAAATTIAGSVLLMVGAVITGTTIALRAERGRQERESA